MPSASGCWTSRLTLRPSSCRSPTVERTAAAAVATGWHAVPVPVHGPTGAPVSATLVVRGTTALVEMADACGLGRLPDAVPAPLTASSRGLGEAIRGALDLGAAEIVVGVGGSASTDGGAGMLAALGARLLDADGRSARRRGRPGSAGPPRPQRARPRLAGTRLVMAADADSPLLGPTGAAEVFAPQKGATASDVTLPEAALAHWADVVESHPDVPTSTNRSLQVRAAGVPAVTYWSMWVRMPGAGAAGGVGFRSSRFSAPSTARASTWCSTSSASTRDGRR